MEQFMSYLAPILMGFVLLVLILGLLNMARSGSASTSQTLMRWRVGLQFLAVIALMVGLYLSST
tara:strand:+ start:112199 stop:112390 length:192 start_codon:yes stop_codon:yes gene_type:complete